MFDHSHTELPPFWRSDIRENAHALHIDFTGEANLLFEEIHQIRITPPHLESTVNELLYK